MLTRALLIIALLTNNRTNEFIYYTKHRTNIGIYPKEEWSIG